MLRVQDIYTNQVVVYEGQYLAFPGACTFIVSTENLVRIALLNRGCALRRAFPRAAGVARWQ